MELYSLAQSLAHAASGVNLDESSISVLAMLVGIVAGWTITARMQPKPKKAPVPRKDGPSPPSGRG